MTPFDLETYLAADPKPRVVTREGNEVRIVCADVQSEMYPILALEKVNIGDGVVREMAHLHKADGSYGNQDGLQLFFDGERGYDPIRKNLDELVEIAYNLFRYDMRSLDSLRQLFLLAGFTNLAERLADWIDANMGSNC